MKPLFIILGIIISILPSRGQEEESNIYYSVGTAIHYGFIIPHATEIEPVSHTNPVGIEVTFNRLDTSFESWKIFNAFWFSGIQLGYFDFQNPGILGGAITATAFAEPVIAHGEKMLFSLRGGAGVSYMTRIYNATGNPSNQFFATRINFPLYVSARLSYKVSARMDVSLAANYNHISNGGMKQPNFGMNFPTVSANLRYSSRKFPGLRKGFMNDVKVERGVHFHIQALAAYKVVDATDVFAEKGALAYGFHLRASRQIRTWYALNAGTEIILDNALKETIRRQGLATDYKRAAITAGQDFLFGKASFSQHFGVYVYSPYRALNRIYQKYELSYRFQKHTAFGVFLKAHGHVADLMGLTFSIIY